MGDSDGGFNGAFGEKIAPQEEVMEILNVSTKLADHNFVTTAF